MPARARPGFDGSGLRQPVGLAGPQRDRATIRDEQRIERIHEIRAGELAAELVHRRPERGQKLDERIVLSLGHGQFDRMEEAVSRIREGVAERASGSLDEDFAQWARHALGAEPPIRWSSPGKDSHAALTASTLPGMAGYVATERISRARPRLAGSRAASSTWRSVAVEATWSARPSTAGALPVDDRVKKAWSTFREEWADATFFLFDPESWR